MKQQNSGWRKPVIFNDSNSHELFYFLATCISKFLLFLKDSIESLTRWLLRKSMWLKATSSLNLKYLWWLCYQILLLWYILAKQSNKINNYFLNIQRIMFWFHLFCFPLFYFVFLCFVSIASCNPPALALSRRIMNTYNHAQRTVSC